MAASRRRGSAKEIVSKASVLFRVSRAKAYNFDEHIRVEVELHDSPVIFLPALVFLAVGGEHSIDEFESHATRASFVILDAYEIPVRELGWGFLLSPIRRSAA